MTFQELLDLMFGGLLGMTLHDIGLRLVLGLGIGFCIGLTGVGGGVLVMPALTVVLKLGPVTAVGTASLYAFLTKIYASYAHFRLKTIDFATSGWFLVGAIPADIIVAWLVTKCAKGPDAAAFKAVLGSFIQWVVLFAAAMLVVNAIWKRERKKRGVESKGGLCGEGCQWLRRTSAIFFGAIVGAVIASTSVGGGVLIVPILIIFFGLSAKKTVGTSIFVALVLTFVTSLVFGKGGTMVAWTSIIMAAGSLGGVYAGSKLSVKLPEGPLQAIVITLIFIAVSMMFMGERTKAPEKAETQVRNATLLEAEPRPAMEAITSPGEIPILEQ